ncbi:hypothetical protein THAOC_04461 [Thalassiosira oceanica]|uniref:Deacetylase sirtuin-type domain-containing protein n=1 Tax=Thalassiosira oceanica TaxID=159749 RepID=K0TJ43_THAOC|nr:hypothetical protein THAOC_04461 [Thalassiosira oceanica]|eukprot:EJK73896.1 hypothetical protein THAOC_04461 [Thalassiosira oceanica]
MLDSKDGTEEEGPERARFVQAEYHHPCWSWDKVTLALQLQCNAMQLVQLPNTSPDALPKHPRKQDFRSATGIYNNLDIAELGVGEAQEVFSIETFNDDPSIFYKCASNLFRTYEPSDTHRFVKWLEDEGRLLRIYTQNIDGLEHAAGVSKSKICQPHGSLETATCTTCGKRYSKADIALRARTGIVPRCSKPKKNKKAKVMPTTKRKSSRLAGRQRGPQQPDDGLEIDLHCCTELAVEPISLIPSKMPDHVPIVLINRNMVKIPQTERFWSLCLLGNSDDVVCSLKLGGYNDEDELERPREGWEHRQPRESVALFDGADISRANEVKTASSIVCDGCNKTIKGAVFTCRMCLAFDLCERCHPVVSEAHMNGAHEFKRII